MSANPRRQPSIKGPRVEGQDPCPVRCLGADAEAYFFRTPAGLRVRLAPIDLISLHALLDLFDGEQAWLRRNFPAQRIVVAERVGGGRVVPIGIDVAAAADWLGHRCIEAHPDEIAAPARGWLSRALEWMRETMEQPA